MPAAAGPHAVPRRLSPRIDAPAAAETLAPESDAPLKWRARGMRLFDGTAESAGNGDADIAPFAAPQVERSRRQARDAFDLAASRARLDRYPTRDQRAQAAEQAIAKGERWAALAHAGDAAAARAWVGEARLTEGINEPRQLSLAWAAAKILGRHGRETDIAAIEKMRTALLASPGLDEWGRLRLFAALGDALDALQARGLSKNRTSEVVTRRARQFQPQPWRRIKQHAFKLAVLAAVARRGGPADLERLRDIMLDHANGRPLVEQAAKAWGAVLARTQTPRALNLFLEHRLNSRRSKAPYDKDWPELLGLVEAVRLSGAAESRVLDKMLAVPLDGIPPEHLAAYAAAAEAWGELANRDNLIHFAMQDGYHGLSELDEMLDDHAHPLRIMAAEHALEILHRPQSKN